jgi:hypothetical protein
VPERKPPEAYDTRQNAEPHRNPVTNQRALHLQRFLDQRCPWRIEQPRKQRKNCADRVFIFYFILFKIVFVLT